MEIDTAAGSEAPPETPAMPETAAGSRWARAAGIACWSAVALVGLFTVVRLFGLERTWYVDTFMAFSPYVALLSVFPLVFAIALRRWRATVVAAVCTAILVTLIAPRTIGGPDPGPGPRLRVMSSNMKVGAADPATLVSLVRTHQVDVLALEEYTTAAQAALTAAGLRTLLPYAAEHALPGSAYGSGIFSRYPLSDEGYQQLAAGFGSEYATIHVPGALPLVVYAVHSVAPITPPTDPNWALSLHQQPPATPHGEVKLLIGDFNATLDHARLRALLATGYRDIATVLGDGLDTTWPYDGRPIPPIAIDHVFADPRIGAVYYGSGQVPRTDHKAIWATLTLPPA